ncbi:MAG TPA: nuclear transport factor 2 family protein [Cyclobacteriaceae bacterium]|nr:nuclear transport factor 2 family protein [Cyclobacteriaceae bacterium]
MKHTLIFVAIALTLAACGFLEGTEESQIRERRQASNDAIAAKDTAAIAKIWTVDYHVVTSRNAEVSGRRTNAIRFAEEFAAKPDIIYVRAPEKIRVFIKWNMASELGTWVGHWTENGQLVELKGNYLAKWHKVNGEWMIRAEIFVPLGCIGGAICDEEIVK